MSGPHNPGHHTATDRVPIRRALISVSDKTGLPELAKALAAADVEMVSTGSTAAVIRDARYTVTDVSVVTGVPEMLDGRVKTLHPTVHGGILADLRNQNHANQLQQWGIEPFELVVVNLYPFCETVASGVDDDHVIENIDIGGPAAVRAAAKNHHNVAVVVSPESYSSIITALKDGGTTLTERRTLAATAFAHTARYDAAIAAWFSDTTTHVFPETVFPETLAITANRTTMLRYGENAHQNAALYTRPGHNGIAQATQLHGKEMSYNNYVDADAALRSVYDFTEPAVAIIKHTNPCGIAIGDPQDADPIAAAHHRAHECDPVSAFGAVIAANRPVTHAMATTVASVFTEVLIAPGFDDDALAVLKTKKNIRLLKLPTGFVHEHRTQENTTHHREVRSISGGLLMQDPDTFVGLDTSTWELVSGEPADTQTRAALEFAWKACRAVKSNAIVLANKGASVGIGMGQVNRVDSCHLAVSRAGDRATGSVAASDAFFPFADGLQVLLNAGVKAVVQPGGSVRDNEVIAAAHAAGVTMYFTGERHFSH